MGYLKEGSRFYGQNVSHFKRKAQDTRNRVSGNLLGVKILVQIDRGQGAATAAVNVVEMRGASLLLSCFANAWVCHLGAWSLKLRAVSLVVFSYLQM